MTGGKFEVSFSSLTVTVSTCIMLEDCDPEDIQDMAIDLAAERIDEELGVAFTDTCHSVHVDILEVFEVDYV